MKKFLFILAAFIIVALAVVLYMTRPVSAPSGDLPPREDFPAETSTSENVAIFSIDASQSEAKFEINEVLNNAPFHVVGTTRDVTGEITVDIDTPSTSRVGTISINARTLVTDSKMRDGMIGRMILKSEEHEFITFTPKSFSGLPESPVIGQTYAFQVTGVLTVAGTSKDVVFDTTVQADSETQITGMATAVIDYNDFGISIPKVPRVASVEDAVTLTFSFVAKRQ